MASLTTLLLPAGAAFAQAPSDWVLNGGFESPALSAGSWSVFSSVSGWTTQSGCGIEIQNHVSGSPLEGAQHLELDSHCPTTIFQDLRTVTGRSYVLSFGYSPRPGVSDNRIRTLWGGQVVADLNANGWGLPDTSWRHVSMRVTAAGSSTRLTFADTSGYDALGGYIDAVSLTDACQADPGLPTLVLHGPSEMTLECGVDTWVDPSAHASDVCGPLQVHKYNSGDDDGDGVPGARDSDDYGPGPDTSAEGTYSVQYIAWTPMGNTVSAIRSVHVDDRTPPTLSLRGAAHMTHACGSGWVDPGVEAMDACYGNVAPQVQVAGYVNGWVQGSYTLTYTLTDPGNNTAVPVTRTVDVVNCPW
ncbi:immunoglobulin-like domain-containing protein [Hyalangium rubrum]|uniref:DUF5011 domain-containing protein n=1 Tax=Hyalangium rubrum TaxID=3103134 RepID=A0ABU5HJ87_9BACT|nr:immunoglobulin-like domain-containing protein [Hyalangium sp. s54d21]MDY7233340.1 DUF5011 domain-containing protein [Hyalangium sp. s54d21]